MRKGIDDFFAVFRARRAVIMAGIELRASSGQARELWTQVMEQRVEEVTAVIVFKPGIRLTADEMDRISALKRPDGRVANPAFAPAWD